MSTPTSDISFVRPRTKTKQIGTQHSHEYEYGKLPRVQRIKEYQYVATHDSTVSAVFQVFVSTLLSLLGPIEHPDPEIDDYCKYNLSRMTDEFSVDPYQTMGDAILSALTTGLSVSENLYDVVNGNIYLRDFVHFDPKTILVRTNKNGRLTENESSLSGNGLKSGVFQSAHSFSSLAQVSGDLQLPLWKINFVNHRRRYGNYYGQSAIEPIYKWSLSTDAIADMMLVALDRFGTPITAVLMPLFQTSETTIDPETQEPKLLTSVEVMEGKFANQDLRGGNIIILPYTNKDLKPEIKNITTANNVGSTFTDAISFCDLQKARGLLMPFALLGGSKTYATDNESQSERQMEIFHHVVDSLYKEIILPFVSQSWHRLIRLSFNRESANTPPSFPLRESKRPEDRVALMQLISGLTEKGYMNPVNEKDWETVRDWINANKRSFDKKDKKFIEDMLINPRKKQEQPQAPNGGDGKNSGNSSVPPVKGKGSPGRPVGSSKPQNVSRPLKASDYQTTNQKLLLDS